MSDAITTPPAPAVDELVRALYRLGRVQRELARHALAELGSQGFTALAVIHTDGPVRISDVAAALGVDTSVASRQIGALTRAGYVAREGDDDDRRVTRLTITDAGSEVLRSSHGRMVDAVAQALSAWSSDEVAALAGRLDLLREDFAAAAHDPEEHP